MSQPQIGTYKTISTLGSGTYGVVRLALDRNGRQVAIKTVQTGQMRADRKELVDAEVAAVQALKHKHIIELKEIIDEEFQIHFVMECARGGDLLQYVNSKGKLDEKEAREFFYQLCSAVEYTHKNAFIHRDLKLENVLLDSARQVKLADWGYAARWAPGKKLTAALGSLHYAAPEVCSGKEYTGPEIDCWSLGVILFALVTGSLPFNADEEWIVYDMILSGTYTIPSSVSSSCASLIRRLLVVNPLLRVTVHDIMQHPWMRPRHQSESHIITLPRLSMASDCRRHSTASVPAPPQRNGTVDTSYVKDRSRRRQSSAEDSVPSTVTILISFNDERHELVYLRPLGWKKLKKDLKKKFGKISIRCRPDGATDIVTLKSETDWSNLGASLETCRLASPAPLVLLLVPKTSEPSSASSSYSSKGGSLSSSAVSPASSSSSSLNISHNSALAPASNPHSILDSLPNGVVLSDTNSTIIYSNPAAERIFGWRTGELIGKKIDILMPPDVARKHDRFMAPYTSSPGSPPSSILNRPRSLAAVRKDGTPVSVLVRVAETRNGDERLFTVTFDDAPQVVAAGPASPAQSPLQSSQPTASQSPQHQQQQHEQHSNSSTPEREKTKKGSFLKKLFG